MSIYWSRFFTNRHHFSFLGWVTVEVFNANFATGRNRRVFYFPLKIAKYVQFCPALGNCWPAVCVRYLRVTAGLTATGLLTLLITFAGALSLPHTRGLRQTRSLRCQWPHDDVTKWKRFVHYCVSLIMMVAGDVELWCFHCCHSEQAVEKTVKLPVTFMWYHFNMVECICHRIHIRCRILMKLLILSNAIVLFCFSSGTCPRDNLVSVAFGCRCSL